MSNTENIEQRFNELAAKWKEETSLYSDYLHMCIQNEAYQQIIGMGKEVLPFIFKSMQKKPDHWFIALNAITGAQPAPKEHWGKIVLMNEDWLQWAKENNYIE